MRLLTRALSIFSCIAALAGPALADDKAIIVLDASGSMWGQIDGKPKLEIARETLRTVLNGVPDSLELGLMAYGHRQKGSCEDIELVVPPAKGTAASIIAAADQMKFLGKTPLSAAVKKAAEDLKFTEEKATVILITDGVETCEADPCALGRELEQSGVDFTAHVVGFGLTAEEGRQVACLAENTGGKYVQAGDAGQLEDALKRTVVVEPAPEPEPAPSPEPAKVEFNIVPTTSLAEGGPALDTGDLIYTIHKANPDGSAGDRVRSEYGLWKGNLEPGDYLISVRLKAAQTQEKVTVESTSTATPHFVLNAGVLKIRALPFEGGEPDRAARITVRAVNNKTDADNGQGTFIVPAGATSVTVKLGAGEVVETFDVVAGETIEKDIIVGVGRAELSAFYSQGGEKVDSRDLTTRVFKAAKKLDGSREQVAVEYGSKVAFDLPAGDYVAVVKMGEAVAEQAFSVKAGALSEASVVLNAGVLAVNAPGATGIRVFEAKANLQGQRKSVAVEYDGDLQTTLVAGDYLIVVTPAAGGEPKEVQATVKAGERAEVRVE